MAKTTKGRIVKPRSIKEGIELAARVYEKHLADGGGSELLNMDGYSWDTTGPTIAMAKSHHEAAEELKAKMEEQYRLRDLAYVEIAAITNAAAAYLKGKYSKTPKKLADWGFRVDDSAPVKKTQKP